MDWEKLKHTPHYGNMYRTKVPGGWLVLADSWAKDEGGEYDATGVGVCFYPDALYQWHIEEDPETDEKSGGE